MRKLAALLLVALPALGQQIALPSGARHWPNPALGTIFYVSNGTTGALGALGIGSPGQCLGISGGVPAWTACGAPPSGTGAVFVVDGVLQEPARLIVGTDIADDADIQESQLALGAVGLGRLLREMRQPLSLEQHESGTPADLSGSGYSLITDLNTPPHGDTWVRGGTLPLASSELGAEYVFVALTDYGMEIHAAGDDVILVDDLATAPGGYVATSHRGSTLTLRAVYDDGAGNGVWAMYTKSGAWSVN